jgi:hypothetical protein
VQSSTPRLCASRWRQLMTWRVIIGFMAEIGKDEVSH